MPTKRGRAPDERRLPHRRRVRRDAADRAADRARRPPTTSSPASRRGSPAPRSASPSPRRRSRRASAGRSCRSRRRCTRGCCSEKLREHGPSVWLVNTGWTGGPAGHGGPPDADRARPARCSHAALSGALDERRDAHRPGVRVRGAGRGARRRPGAARSALDLGAIPRRTTRRPRELAAMFRENFAQFADVDPEVAAAGPAE